MPGADQYTVWSTDDDGNYVQSWHCRQCRGPARALQSLESSFHQDLNGDWHNWPSAPSCSCWNGHRVQWSDQPDRGRESLFTLRQRWTGPSLKYSGADVAAGQFGGWKPIGAEQTASGYEVLGRCRVPISTRSGTPTATATTSECCIAVNVGSRAAHCNRLKQASIRISMAMA